MPMLLQPLAYTVVVVAGLVTPDAHNSQGVPGMLPLLVNVIFPHP